MRGSFKIKKEPIATASFLTLVLVVAVLLFCGGYYLRETSHVEKSLLVQESARVDALTRIFEYEIRPIANDLRQLANGDGLQAYLTTGQSADLDRVIQQSVFFSRLNLEFDQIRYLNERGMEILRVDQNGRIVPPGELQDKSDRPYFQKTFKLAPGQMYLSALDLNVENGRVELPPKPMLRFATPIFDQTGQARGVYVINCLGSGFFSHLQAYRPEMKQRLRIFNAQGYWLKAAQPEKEWGFLFPERRDTTLARTAPELWARLAGEPKGQAHYAGGILSWQRVDLRQLAAGDLDMVVAEDAFLIIASEISTDEYGVLFTRLRMVFGILTVLLLAAALVAGRQIYARRQALQALRHSEENLNVTLHSIGDAVLATDTTGRVTRMNRIAEKLTGWTQAEALGRLVSEVFHIINEATRKPADIPVDKVLATGEIHGLANHTVIIARDGAEYPIADSAAPIRDKDDRILGVVLVFRDVTEEHKASAEIALNVRALTDFKHALDEHAVVTITDAHGRITYINDKFCTLSKYSREELLAKDNRIVNSGHHPKAFIRELWDTITAGRVWKGEIKNRAKDGTFYWVNTTIVPFFGEDGKPIQFIAIQADITERKLAQEELDRFFNLSLDFLCISSADGYFKRVSSAVTDILGWSVEEFLAHPYLDHVHPDDREVTQREVETQVVKGNRVLNFENRYRHKDGSWRVLSWRSMPQGQLMYAIARDVTEQKRADEELRESNDRLEIRVLERTAELACVNESLRHSERRFRALIEHGGDSISLINADNKIAYLSPAIASVEGYTPEELIGRSGLENTHPDDLSLVQALVEKLLANPGKPFQVLWRRRHKDGRWLWLEGVATNLLDDPAVGGIVTNYRDVTERQRTEQALRESEERFRFLNDLALATRTLVDSTQIMMVMARMLGEHLRVSRCAYADVEDDGEQFSILHDYIDGCATTVGNYQLSLFGERAVATLKSGQTLIIRDVNAELSPGEGADMFNAINIKAIITCPLVKEGSLRAMMAVHQTTPRNWKPDEIALVQDVVERCWSTIERRTAEEKAHQLNIDLERRVVERTAQLESANVELTRKRAELQSLFESLPGLYLVLTPDLKVIAASDAYLKATMTTREGILGCGLFDAFPDNPDDPAATGTTNLRASLDRVRQTAAPDTMAIQKYDVRRPNGVFEEHYWSPINSPVLGADRKVEYIIHRVEDVTEFVRQKQRSPQPGQPTEDIRARMEQMEAEIFRSTQRVQATNQQLHAANKELEAFSYSVSHDLRSPLRHIDGFVDLLNKQSSDKLDDRGRRYLRTIAESARQMGILIDDLLAFSRMGRTELRQQIVNMNDLAQETLAAIKTDLTDRNVEWKISPLPQVHADDAMLRQVFVNLIANAVKYTRPRNPAVIEIGCIESATECEFFVRDNGVGFDMEYVGKLFGVFQRLHRSDEFEGTGIGLANVQRIIQRHGGRTWAEGKIDAGATFHFTLPKSSRT